MRFRVRDIESLCETRERERERERAKKAPEGKAINSPLLVTTNYWVGKGLSSPDRVLVGDLRGGRSRNVWESPIWRRGRERSDRQD